MYLRAFVDLRNTTNSQNFIQRIVEQTDRILIRRYQRQLLETSVCVTRNVRLISGSTYREVSQVLGGELAAIKCIPSFSLLWWKERMKAWGYSISLWDEKFSSLTLSLRVVSHPWSISVSAISKHALTEAEWRAVYFPWLLWSFKLAPREMRRLTTSKWLFSALQWSAVFPYI